MNKSYILNFDNLFGDYVITKEEKSIKNCNNLRKRDLFIQKNCKKQQNLDKSTLHFFANNGFLENLDIEILKHKEDKKQLENDLYTLNNIENSDFQNLENVDILNQAISLLSQLYSNFKTLNQIYQVLRDINQDNTQTFTNMISDNIILQGSLLNIYNEITELKEAPYCESKIPPLSDNYIEILQLASSSIQGMRDINIRLIKLFNVENINRQLKIIEDSLSIQFDNLNQIRLNVLCREIKGL